jgi:hypothetical protein
MVFMMILISTPAFSQINQGISPSPVSGSRIYGKVIAAESGAPLVGVLVVAFAGQGGRGALTDQAGNFNITNYNLQGNWTCVSFMKFGYWTHTRIIYIAPGQSFDMGTIEMFQIIQGDQLQIQGQQQGNPNLK